MQISSILFKARFDVVACATAAEGLALLKLAPRSALVVDFHLADMGGVDFVRICLEQELLSATIMTASESEISNAVQALRQGVSDFLPQPYDHRLAQSLRRALREYDFQNTPDSGVCAAGKQSKPTVMTTFLDKLNQDHVHMAQLLDLLAAQLTLLRDPDGEPDYRLMQDIAYYFICFPDSVHHRAEDAVFRALEEKSPSQRKRIEALRLEHVELAEMGQEFNLLLEGVCSGHVVTRDKIVSAGENFLERQRRHMDTEEGEIFVIAKAYLNDEIVAAFASIHAEVQGPLFGTDTRDSFNRLRQAIMEKA